MSAAPDAVSDASLVTEVAAGTRDALAELYRRHGGAVWSLCVRVCRDQDLADDVCQTVFCELWSSPSRFDPVRGGFRSWLLAQAHSRAVDCVRSEASRRRRQERHHAGAVPAASPEVEAQAQLAALAQGVRRALGDLPPGERDAILVTYFGGQTYRDAAVLLGQPEGTVKSRIRSGLKRLRTALEASGVTP